MPISDSELLGRGTRVVEINTEIAYKYFLQKYPNSKYKDDIIKRINILKAKEIELQKEEIQREYNAALLENTEGAYKDFLQKYPNSKYSDKIREKLNILEAKKEKLILVDNVDWRTAKKSNTISEYNKYLELHKDGRHVDEAKQSIESLQKAKERQKILKWHKSEEYKKLISKFSENFLNSVMVVREGVLDFGKVTIRKFFFAKPFKTSTTEDLSGNKIKVTPRISGVKVHGNFLSFDITIFGDEQPDTKITLNFKYLSGYKESLLNSAKVKNYETNKSDSFYDVGSKVQILAMISNLY